MVEGTLLGTVEGPSYTVARNRSIMRSHVDVLLAAGNDALAATDSHPVIVVDERDQGLCADVYAVPPLDRKQATAARALIGLFYTARCKEPQRNFGEDGPRSLTQADGLRVTV